MLWLTFLCVSNVPEKQSILKCGGILKNHESWYNSVKFNPIVLLNTSKHSIVNKCVLMIGWKELLLLLFFHST